MAIADLFFFVDLGVPPSMFFIEIINPCLLSLLTAI